MEERLQKIIARAGLCSRREAEELITGGMVTVNGTIVTELGSRADAQTDHIKVNGKLIQLEEGFRYILLNKPKGVISTVNDPEGRPTVTDLIKGVKARIYPVGRLDFNTEGVILLTNDGDLTNTLLRPRSRCPKTYLTKVHGVPNPKDLDRLRRGITIDGTRYGKCDLELLRAGQNSWLQVTLFEGKNHQVRNMFESIARPVSKLKRIAFAFLTARDLAPGEWRDLTEVEIARLKRGDYNPLVPINPTIYLREYGVKYTREDRAREAGVDLEARDDRPRREDTGRSYRSRESRAPRGRDSRAFGASRGKSSDRTYRPRTNDSRDRDERGGREESRDSDRSYRGGDARGGRDDRSRDSRGSDRGYRGREEGGGRDDRPRDTRGSVRGYHGREERGGRDDRPRDARGSDRGYPGREERGGRDDRPRDARGSDRGYRGREERGGRDDRSRDTRGSDRGYRGREEGGGRDDRPRDTRGSVRGYPGREERGGRDDRPRDTRGSDRGYRGREERGGRDDRSRDTRGSVRGYRGREERGGRDDRPRDARGSDRGNRGREERGGRDDRPRDARGSDRGNRGREERGGRDDRPRDTRGSDRGNRGREDRGGRDDRSRDSRGSGGGYRGSVDGRPRSSGSSRPGFRPARPGGRGPAKRGKTGGTRVRDGQSGSRSESPARSGGSNSAGQSKPRRTLKGGPKKSLGSNRGPRKSGPPKGRK